MKFTNLSEMILSSVLANSKRNVTNNITYYNLYKKSNDYLYILQKNNCKYNERVCVYSNKTIDFIAIMLATWRNNNIFVPLPYNNKLLSEYIIKTVKPKIIFDKTVQNLNKTNLINNSIIYNINDPALILFTSGTTSLSKGVVLSHKNILSNLDMINKKYLDDITKYDSSYSLLPWHHCYGLVCELLYLISKGSKIIIPTKNTPKEIFNDIKWNSPTLLYTVPKILEIIYKNDKSFFPNLFKKKYIFGNNIRMLSVGGAVCNINLINFINKNYNIPVYQGYGLTECSPIISLNSKNNNKINSVGQILDNIEISFTLDNEIVVNGDNIMMGYLNYCENDILILDKPFFYRDTKQWFNTKDTGYLDKDNFLYIKGRTSNIYKLSNGKFIDPQHIENLLQMLKQIENVVIYGIDYNIAIIQLNKDYKLNSDELLELINSFLKNKVEQYEIPKKVIIINEPITIENKLLTQKLEPNRKLIIEKYF